MGAWGTLKSAASHKPKAPVQKPYISDPYFDEGGAGTQHGRGADESAYRLLQKYLEREPGYTDEEQRTMYDVPAEQQKVQEQGALRSLNQGSAGAGSFGSGGTQAGRAGIVGGGIRARAGLKQSVIVQAAQAAMEDRMRQIQAASDYSSSRLGMTSANREGANAYNMGLNQLDMNKWQTELEQYNYDREKTREFIKMIVSSAGGCWVAEAIFGKDSQLTHLARFYVNNLAPTSFREWYLENGVQLALKVEGDPQLKAILRPLFVSFAVEASIRMGGEPIGRLHAGHGTDSVSASAQVV